ncbi:MAG: putative sodium-solute symporter [Ignavibacteriae bacterium]|nr:MAG: putative sodium-solute symporter [Ignavibacteriota bacterium]
MIQLTGIDIFLIIVYFLSVIYVGFRAIKKTNTSTDDFLLAGRSLTLPIFVMTLVSTWYGGILGVGEFSYKYGISNWFVQGLPYYFFAAIFAFFLAKKIRESNLFTIPDKLHLTYDKRTAIFGAILTFILMTPAPYVLMLSVFLQLLFKWNIFISLLVTATVAVSYLYWGGFRSDIYTDILEFFLMFIGFAIIIPFCVINYGGFEFLEKNLPTLHLTWHGGNSFQFILVWFFIALWTLVDPAFYQRCYAAKDPNTAQKGILISIVFWFIFDAMTAFAGLYSRAIITDLENPVMAYPMLAENVLPPIAKGLFYIGMLATIMSTLNTLALVSAQTLGRDLVSRSKNFISEKDSVIWTKIGLILSFIFSVFIALIIPSVIKIWYTIGTIVIPGLLIPLIAGYFKNLRIDAKYAFFCMSFSFLVALFWLIGSFLFLGPNRYFLNIEPMLPGLLTSVVIWFIGRFNYVRKL